MSKSQSKRISGITAEVEKAFGSIVDAMIDTYSDAPKADLIIIGKALGASEDELRAGFSKLYRAEIVDDGSDITSLDAESEGPEELEGKEGEENIN